MATRFKRFTSSFATHNGVRAGLVALGAMLAACSSLLGIEDLSEEPGDAGAGGTAQAGSSSGANGGKSGSGTGGASANGGKAGDSGKGGSGAAGAGATGGGGSSGASGGSGGSTGGSSGAGGSTGGSGGSGGTDMNGGEAGMGTVETGAVSGTIIDFWGHKLSGIPVKIGDTSATTDQNGKFTVADVPETYDVAFVIQTQSPTAVYEWVYLGLTRRDPTLQVKTAFDYNDAHFYVTQVNGGTFDSGFWFLGFGSNDGANSGSEPLTTTSGGFDRRPEWYGPNTTNWTLHSLFLDQTGGIPTDYVAYETKTAVTNASDVNTQDFEMDLSMQDITTGNVSGGIVESSGQGRTNSVYVRFTSGAAVPVVDRVDASANAYQYLVPDLPNGTISVCAAERHDDYSYAIAHRDQRQVGDTGVDLVIPPPVAGLLPPDETANVGPTTPFTFGAGDPENKGYLVRIESESYRQGVFIVTTERELTLDRIPVVGTGLILKNQWHNWDVETHGKYASVDAMAGPNGFLDSFAMNDHIPQGPSRADGAFTTSIVSDFQTAP